MKYFVLLNLLLLLTISTAAQEQTSNDVPYIYYYSGALNGIVIERADGTDSRIIGQGLVDEDVLFITGPGWSPDGKWFAWRILTHRYNGVGKAYAVSADGQSTLEMLTDFPCVYSLSWHPTKNILLVYGSMVKTTDCSQRPSPIATYWLIDADTQTRLATFSIDSGAEWQSTPPIYWFPEEGQLRFHELVYINNEYDLQIITVTMAFDGSVQMQPISIDEARMEFDGLIPNTMAHEEWSKVEFVNWMENPVAKTIEPPTNSGGAGYAVSGQWNSSYKWILVGNEFCFAGCAGVTGRVNIFNPETGHNREISDCGGFPACVGWLPERVKIVNLPNGQLISVLSAPDMMDFSKTNTHLQMSEVATHELICNSEASLVIQNIVTGEIDFTIPNYHSCEHLLPHTPELILLTEQIIFALSPDKKYYAITDSSEYTSLHDAETGESIAILNFYGIELSFSKDSRYLITVGRNATATWDIQDLLNP